MLRSNVHSHARSNLVMTQASRTHVHNYHAEQTMKFTFHARIDGRQERATRCEFDSNVVRVL